MPTNGAPHPHTKMVLLDSLVPIGIVTALTIGFALIVAGVFGIEKF
jgi:hypothetical protein